MAQAFNVSHRTLRFYEDRRLLVPTREGTARYYTSRDKTRLKRILHGKQLGFTLTEIREMLAQSDKAPASTELALKPDQIVAQIAYLEQQRNDIEGAILQLRRAQTMLASG